MARSVRFANFGGIGLPQQIGRMARAGFRPRFRNSRVVWIGTVQPTPISEIYTMKIKYRLGGRPHVVVLDPPLRDRGDAAAIPHTFSDGSICLHLSEDWAPTMFVADTILPWVSHWLLYYEHWLALGDWLGGGVET